MYYYKNNYFVCSRLNDFVCSRLKLKNKVSQVKFYYFKWAKKFSTQTTTSFLYKQLLNYFVCPRLNDFVCPSLKLKNKVSQLEKFY